MESSSRSFIVYGETGSGKSTFIAKTFKPSVPINVPTTRISDTSEVTSFIASSDSPSCFRNAIIKDTPGLLDTRGVTSAEIFKMIELSLLQDSSLDGKISGVIIVESTIFPRSRIKNLIGELVASFTSQILKSCVLVLNRYALISQEILGPIKNETCEMVACAAERAGENTIPIVVLNCSEPDEDEINSLANSFKSLQPYYFENIKVRNQEIERNYQIMIKDPKNFVTDTKQRITYSSVNKVRAVPIATTTLILRGIPLVLILFVFQNYTESLPQTETYYEKRLSNDHNYYKTKAKDEYLVSCLRRQ